MEGLVEEFYEDNGDNYIDDTEDLSELQSRGARVINLEAS